jgi:hypothetical protein
MHTDTDYQGKLYDVDERLYRFTRCTHLPRNTFANPVGRQAKLLMVAVGLWIVAAIILAVWY